MNTDWDASAQAWIEVMGDDGDFGRRYVLDAPMLARVRRQPVRLALDIGCGEGRFCRMLRDEGIVCIGIDPTEALIAQARRRDPEGDYRIARGESLGLPDASVDLAIAYLSLIDIPDLGAALAEIHRVLQPGGRFLIANLQSFNTAAEPLGWHRGADGILRFSIDRYLEPRPVWTAWRGIGIWNHHRPMEAYIGGLLEAGFELCHFAEPPPQGGDPGKADRYRRAPNFLLMEWIRR